jgi:hypothetical protein
MFSSETSASPQQALSLFLPLRDDKYPSTVKKANGRSSKHKKDESGRNYVRPTELDVLRGRGGGVSSSSGKQRLFDIVRPLASVYASLKRGEKAKLCQKIVETVHGWGGRFLEMEKDNRSNKLYYALDNAASVKLVGQKFRDDPTRRKMFKDRKSKAISKQTNEDRNDESCDESEISEDAATSSDSIRIFEALSCTELSQITHTDVSDVLLAIGVKIRDGCVFDAISGELPQTAGDEQEVRERLSLDDPTHIKLISQEHGSSFYSFPWEDSLLPLPSSSLPFDEEELNDLYRADMMDDESESENLDSNNPEVEQPIAAEYCPSISLPHRSLHPSFHASKSS